MNFPNCALVTFTTAHLVKHNAILAEGRYICTVCRGFINDYHTVCDETLLGQVALTSTTQAPLKAALCTNARCTAVTHLSCLGRHFSAQNPTHLGLVPRGGECPKCGDYVLWGDIVRGCYRRQAGGTAEPESEADDGSDGGAVSSSAGSVASEGEAPPRKALNKGKAKAIINPRKATTRTFFSWLLAIMTGLTPCQANPEETKMCQGRGLFIRYPGLLGVTLKAKSSI